MNRPRFRRCSRAFLAAVAGALGASSTALATDPDLVLVSPPGATQGSSVTLRFEGQRLKDAEEVLWYDPGFTVKEWTTREDKRAEAVVEIAADCAVGEHFLRLRTRSGLSQAKTFWVGRFPVIDEVEPNNTVSEATPATLQTTVHGIIDAGDVDHIAVELTAGTRLSAEVEALRLGRGLIDPCLAILDPDGVVLAASDDSPLWIQDTFVQAIALKDGRYTVRIRDAARAGSDDAAYRLHIGTFPRPTAVYPAGGRPGETLDLTFLGDIAGPFTSQVTIPKSPGFPFGLYPEQGDDIAPSWNPFRAVNVVSSVDVEPNDDRESATPTAAGGRAICGVLGVPGDQDWFRFTPKVGEAIRVRMMATFVGSPVDALLWVYGPDGKQIGYADDNGGPDGFVDFTPKLEGEHLIRVGDHLGDGGPDHIYWIEINPIRPSMSLTLPRYGRDSQARQVVLVPRGGRYATVMVTNRSQWSGEISLQPPELPAGVTMAGETIDADMNTRVVVFEAAPDAPLAGNLGRFVARAANPDTPVQANFYQGVELVIGPPNQTVFYRKNLTRFPVAVVEALPFSIDIEPMTTPLLRTGVAKLRVTATRAEGFDAPITVRMLLKPSGMSAPSTVTIAKGATEVDYPIDANRNARLGDIDLAVLGEATVAGATAFSSSQLHKITIAEPFVDGSIAMAVIPAQGEGDLRLTLAHKRPLPGPATLQLLNLPAHVTAAPVTIAAGETDVLFRVAAGAKAKTGKHKNLLCEVSIQDGDEVMVQRIAQDGVLRVDPPAPAAAPAITEAAPRGDAATPDHVAPTPAAKPMSRLEVLRKEAEARAAAAAEGSAGRAGAGAPGAGEKR